MTSSDDGVEASFPEDGNVEIGTNEIAEVAGRREEKSGGKRRGRPGSDPKKPRNFNRSSSRD